VWTDRDQRQAGGVGGSGSDAVALSWGIDDRQIGAIVAGQLEGLSQAAGLCRDEDGNICGAPVFPFHCAGYAFSPHNLAGAEVGLWH